MVDVARLIKALVTDGKWNVQPTRLVWMTNSSSSPFGKWIREVSPERELYNEYYKRFSPQSEPRHWTTAAFKLFDRAKVIIALAKWIDRSVKS